MKIQHSVKEHFKQLCISIGKAKNHMKKTQSIKDAVPIQQKGRQIPIYLHEGLEKELDELID